jgi:hypothetical protein
VTTAAARKRHPATRHLKSPLAAPAGAGVSLALGQPAPASGRPPARQVLSERQETLEEFGGYLRTTTNRETYIQ